MKKFLCFIVLLASVFSLQACHKDVDIKEKNESGLNIVTSIFPTYDWAGEITKGTGANIINLTDKGVNLHNYEPTPEDIANISKSNLFIFVGAHSDKWAKKALKNAPQTKALNLMKLLKEHTLKEEIKEGMEDPDECPCGEDHHNHDDEHVWLSIKNAKLVCQEIAKNLSEIDKKNSKIYMNNLNEYLAKLDELDRKYEQEINKSRAKTMVFGDRFPFRYLLNDYNIDYYAAFTGCSAESEASFETLAFLVNKLDELGLKYIYSLSDSDGKIARTIVDNSNEDVKILSMNSLEAVSSKDGLSYLDIMEDNLKAIIEGLN